MCTSMVLHSHAISSFWSHHPLTEMIPHTHTYTQSTHSFQWYCRLNTQSEGGGIEVEMEMVRAVFTYCFKATALLEYCNCQIPNQKTHTQTHTHISVTRKQLYNRTLFTKCIPQQKLSVPSVLSAPSTLIITSLLHLHIHSVTLQTYKVEKAGGRT